MLFVILEIIAFFPVIFGLALYDRIKSRGKVHLYGIRGYFGLPGTGKTMAMCKELKRLRRKYGDKIYICTNFNFIDEDFAFKTWHQLTESYDKPLVVAWDEIQNEFNSRDFKNFPIALLTQLTQVRKGNGIRLLYTSQRFGFVDKNFRSLSADIGECKTLLGRYTYVKLYDILTYEELLNTVEAKKRLKIHPLRVVSFFQTQSLRDSYDSFKMLETAKFKADKGGYMSRVELSRINQNN